MNEAKHTPGPWCISDENPKIIKEDRSMIGSNHGVLIASACGHHNSGFYASDEQTIANASLIAAAPDLFEALAEIVIAADEGGWNQLDPSFSKARAAIAKATGRADSGDGPQKDNP